MPSVPETPRIGPAAIRSGGTGGAAYHLLLSHVTVLIGVEVPAPRPVMERAWMEHSYHSFLFDTSLHAKHTSRLTDSSRVVLCL